MSVISGRPKSVTSGRPKRQGGQDVSIEDVAIAAGVSTATVSRALRGLPRVSTATREKVLKAAGKLGYATSPTASGLASGKTRTIGVLALPTSRWFHSHALEGIAQELSTSNYRLALLNLKDFDSRPECLSIALRRRVDAVLILAVGAGSPGLKRFPTMDVPAVSIGRLIPNRRSIGIDDRAATLDAVRHLARLEHRKIAILHGYNRFDIESHDRPSKTQEFQAVMAEAGLTVFPQWLQKGETSVNGGRRAFARLWDHPGERPTAILCWSDEMAIGILIEAARIGVRIPSDMSLVCFEGSDFSASYGLTAISQDPGNQARLGTRMLLDHLNGNPAAIRSIVAPHRLHVRSTTSQAPHLVAQAMLSRDPAQITV